MLPGVSLNCMRTSAFRSLRAAGGREGRGREEMRQRRERGREEERGGREERRERRGRLFEF